MKEMGSRQQDNGFSMMSGMYDYGWMQNGR